MDFDFNGVWGKMREDFLRDNKPEFYKSLKSSGELYSYLDDFQDTYSRRAEFLTKKLKEKYGVDEEFFSRDSLTCILLSTKIFLQVTSKLKAEIEK